MPNKQKKSAKQAPSIRSSAPGVPLRYALGVLLIAVGTAGALSLVAAGGSVVMTAIRAYLRGLAGSLSPVLPFLVVWCGAALVVSCYHRVSFRAPFFALLLYLSVLGLVTSMTKVRTQGVISLLDYIKIYNNQHFTANSYGPASFPAYFQQLFHWGYRMDSLGAGGALSLLTAYPLYVLFGAVLCQLMGVVVTVGCAFALFGVRPSRLIRGASDAMERFRQRRSGQRKEAPAPAPAPAPQPSFSPIQQERPAYANASNPYSNVRWVYDEPAPEPAAAPAQDQDFRRPEMTQDAPLAQNGPFTPLNTQNELYHESFVLHPDGAYEVNGNDLPWTDAPATPEVTADAGEDITPSGQAAVTPEPAPWMPPAFDVSEPEQASPEQTPWQAPAQAAQPSVAAPKAPDPLPWETDAPADPPQSSVKPQPSRTAPMTPAPVPWENDAPADPPPSVKPQPSRTASRTPAPELKEADTPAEQPAAPKPERQPAAPEDDGHLSKWQKQLKDLQASLNQTRQQQRELSQSRPEPVHTAPVDLPVINHEPVRPQPQSDPAAGRMDSTPVMPEHKSPAFNGPYTPPPVSFLSLPKAASPGESTLEDQSRAAQIERTLKTFNVDAQVREITHGPAITRFALKLAEGVKVKQVVGVLDNLMLEMGSDRIRLETPIPGTSYIGLEVPNSKVSPVMLREVLDSPEMRSASSPLSVALGKDIAGTPIIGDLSRMPHLLIAGATGSGKSVCINSIVCSLLYRASPKDVRLIMVDPKQVELQVYNGIPHLLIPVVCDPKKAAVALNWTVNEMLDRYARFSKQNVRSLEGYNKKVPEDDRLPHIVVIIDEMADLMEVCRKDVEESIRRLAALARAAGIYLVLATQRPSVDVITGVIKNNIPSRIAFTVSSGVDSRTIIDINGAEKLMGKGDMLYLPVGASKPLRVQGCFVSDDEVARIAENIQARYQPDYNTSIQDALQSQSESAASAQDDAPETVSEVRENEFSDLLNEAIRMAVQDGQTSISMLQRTLRIGYARAGRIIDEMTKRGIISESEGSKPRKTIISRDEYVQMMSEGLLNGDNE